MTGRLRVSFAWYDVWVGAFWDRKRRVLYVCPLPTLLVEWHAATTGEVPDAWGRTVELPANVAAKVQPGHDMEWDPPSGISRALRWTCRERTCGLAVLDYEGNVYGSATERPCTRENTEEPS